MPEMDHLVDPPVELMTERLVLVGRLVASIVHEVSNPMQAIRGALVLAGEEIDDQEAVQAYLDLCLQETDRVLHLTTLLRQLYRPDSNQPHPVELNQVIKSTLRVAHDEMNRQGVAVQQVSSGEGVHVESIGNQIELAMLYLFIYLAAVAGAARAYCIAVTTSRLVDRALITILVPLPPQAAGSEPPLPDRSLMAPNNPALGPLYTIIEAHQGTIDVHQQPDRWVIQIQLPHQAP